MLLNSCPLGQSWRGTAKNEEAPPTYARDDIDVLRLFEHGVRLLMFAVRANLPVPSSVRLLRPNRRARRGEA